VGKTIGVVGAMEQEIALLKSEMLKPDIDKPEAGFVSVKKAANTEFIEGRLSGARAVLVRCGVGKVNAAVCTQALIDLYGVNCVINTGVAGGVSPDVKLGDVVISTGFIQYDVDIVGAGYEPGILPGGLEAFYRADAALADCAVSACAAVYPQDRVHAGLIATADRFVTSSEAVRDLRRDFNPLCLDMETAAIAQACALNGVPFVAVRSISDNADEEAGMAFDQYLELAAEKSCRIVCKMAEELK